MPNKDAEPTIRQDSDEAWVELEPPPTHYDDAWQSASIEPVKKMYGVNSAAALHPSLAFIDAKLVWPSSAVSSFMSQEILAILHQARGSFISNGFAVNSDPVNPLGDGKSWALRCEITDKIAGDPIEIATLYQQEYASPSPAPFWDGGLITVPLWRSSKVYTGARSADPQLSGPQNPSAKFRSKLR